ncbi:MAG TPA: hotdog domain-containing protein [Candidatus Dormibacteraeota bacterium]|nr:hotdog domain-containing protein [Candidatus Dormibacteraeota bacterium]
MSPADSSKIEIGLEGICEREVPREWTLAHIDPNLPAVFSTPSMICLMEIAASYAINPALPPGVLTVGTRIEVDHLKAVPAGVFVVAKATLIEISGRRLIFQVEATSGSEVIGRGRVHRAIVDHVRFDAIASGKPPSA